MGIAGIVTKYQPQLWALACPLLLSQRIIEWLPPAIQASLAVVGEMEVKDINLSNVFQVFDTCGKDYNSAKEHC